MDDPCRLDVVLESKEGVYSGGQTLRGVVRLELAKSVEMIALELKVYGGAFVKWSEKNEGDCEKPPLTVERTAEEIYFDDIFVLWGQGSRYGLKSSVFDTLEAGRHLFPFNVLLLPGIPCSYEGPYGWVRYHLTAVLVTPSDATSVRTSRGFPVIRDLELDSSKHIQGNLEEQRDFALHANCCMAGRINATLKLAKAEFVPGEKILIDTDVINASPQRVKNTSLVLRQVIRYGSESKKSRRVKLELCRINGDIIKPGKRQCWCTKGIEVPPTPPSSLDGCKFIDIHYEVALLIDTSPTVLSLSVPITIGTVPKSDIKFASCIYKAQPLPPNPKIKSVVIPESAHSEPENNDRPLPLYPYYCMQTPQAKIIRLHQSPHARKKQYLIMGDNTLQESTV